MSKEKVSYTKTQFKKEFARLMEKTSIPDNLPQEDANKILKKLHDFVQPHIPSKLFRFRKCGDTIIQSQNSKVGKRGGVRKDSLPMRLLPPLLSQP
jgi:hypothetical protein